MLSFEKMMKRDALFNKLINNGLIEASLPVGLYKHRRCYIVGSNQYYCIMNAFGALVFFDSENDMAPKVYRDVMDCLPYEFNKVILFNLDIINESVTGDVIGIL
jgi:hypothetical protein